MRRYGRSPRHTFTYSRSLNSSSAAFAPKAIQIGDFLDHIKVAKDYATWKADPYSTIKPYTPLANLSGVQGPMPLNTQMYPMTARNVDLKKLNYYSLLYDYYMITDIVIQYTPGVPVTEPGFLTFYFEPNATYSPIIQNSSVPFDWLSYASRQKYGKSFPVWQEQTMVIHLKPYWMRTVPQVGSYTPSGLDPNANAPDPLTDYGCFYFHSDKIPTTNFQELGIVNIYMNVRFRDFSFGRTGTQDKPSPNAVLMQKILSTNSQAPYEAMYKDPGFIEYLQQQAIDLEAFKKMTTSEKFNIWDKYVESDTFIKYDQNSH